MSGYRTPFYNERIGNVRDSQHTAGTAADIFVDEKPDGRMDDLDRDGVVTRDDAVWLFKLVDGMDRTPAASSAAGSATTAARRRTGRSSTSTCAAGWRAGAGENAGTMPRADRPEQPRQDPPTVTPEGHAARAADRRRRRALPAADRGSPRRGLEVYRPSWGVHDEPLVYVYQVRIRPGAIKGWVIHEHQDDRLFFVSGSCAGGSTTIGPDSPTRGRVNDLVFSERAPALLVIPRGVYHAVRNIGTVDAIFVNMPTRPYEHESPDKLRLPLTNALHPVRLRRWPRMVRRRPGRGRAAGHRRRRHLQQPR